MLHSIGSTLQEYLLDFEELSVVKVIVGIVDLMNHFGDAILALVELIRVLFASLFVVCEEGLNEFNQLVHCFGGGKNNFVLDHHLNDLDSHSSLVLEFHVLHQRRVVVHGQNLDGVGLKRSRQEFHQQFHAVLV